MEAITEELARIIDTADAAIMLEDLADGCSLTSASLYLTTRQYKREDFVSFRKAHGDIITAASIAMIGARG